MAKKTKEKKIVAPKEPAVAGGTMVMCDDGVGRAVTLRATAIANGDNRYFVGVPCVNGHMVERKVKGYTCTTCARLKMKDRKKRRLEEDPDYKAAQAAKRNEKRKFRMTNDPDYKAKMNQKAKERRLRKAAAKAQAKAEAQIKE